MSASSQSIPKFRPLYAAHPAPPPTSARDKPAAAAAATGRFTMIPAERTALLACLASAFVAIAFPYPATKFIVGALLAVLFTALSLRHFHIAVALFAFCLPLLPLMPEGSFLVRGLNLQTLFVIGFVVLSLFAGNRKAVSDEQPKNVLAVPLVAFILVVLLSAVHSAATTSISFGNLFADVKAVLIYSSFAYFTFKHIREDREKQFVLLLIMAVITLTAARSMQEVFSGGFALNPLGHRAVSLIVGQPNLWGGFLAMYSFLFLSTLSHWPMPRWAKVLVYLGLGLVLINLVYTLSRGAWMALGASLVIVALMNARKLLVPIVLVGGIVYVLLPGAAVERFQSGFEGEYDPSLLTRQNVEEDEAASRIIQWRTFGPLMLYVGPFGAGFGQYSAAFADAGLGVMDISPHSSVIQTGAEQGMLGLLIYFWLFAVVYRRAAALLKDTDSPVTRCLALALLGCTVCLLLLDLTGARSRSSQVMLFYWMLAGMTLNVPLKREQR